MNKPKPEDVMRVLECCDGTLGGCERCPNYKNRFCCTIKENALALLREKDADIKRRDAKIDTLQKQVRQYGAEIGKKNAEIERLKTENGILKKRLDEAETNIELLQDAVGNVSDDEVEQLEKLMSMERAEAITEFAEKLKSNNEKRDGLSFKVVSFDTIDQIAEKLKGATDGKSDL